MRAAWLTVSSGPDSGQEFKLTGVSVLGRSPEAEVVLRDPEVSKRHAAVTVDDLGVTVEDLGSTNGTLVDGKAIEGPTALGHEDVLQIGDTTFEVHAPLAPPPEATRVPPSRGDVTPRRAAPRLMVVQGPDAGREIELEGRIVIGRGECDLVLTDTEVSARHAAVTVGPAGVSVEDLDSTNGTFLNDQEISGSHLLRNADTVQVGTTLLRLQAPAGAGAPAPPPRAFAPDQLGTPLPAIDPGRSRLARVPSRLAGAAPGKPRRAGVLGIPVGRRSKFIVLVAWVVLIPPLGILAGKFEGAQNNDQVSFLPGSAESVVALEKARQFPSGSGSTATIVYRRASGLTAADRTTIDRDRTALNNDPPPTTDKVSAPVFSRDGSAALLLANIRSSDEIVKAVPQIRKAVKHPKTGLVASVTGPAGFAADLRDVFGGISGTLLISTALLVTLLLIAVYRSPVFWLIPLFSVVMAELMSRALGYLLANAGLTVTGESAGILSVLVFGAGTDYALLLIARFREELRREDDSHAAGISALRKAGPAIVASGGTVAAGLVCLVVAEVNGTAGLGPIGALGIVLAMASSLTLLPALLVIFGRRAFWPRVPIYGEAGSDETLGRWRRIGERLGQSPRRAWVTTVCALAVLPIGLTSLNSDLTSGDAFRNQVDAVAGQKLIAKAFAPGASAPATVIVGDTAHLDQVRGDLTRAPGVASLGATEKGGTAARFDLVLKDDPYSKKGINRIPALRKVAKNAGGPTTLIGGPTAQERDLRDSAARDNRVVPPLVFVVIFAVLALLLRAIVAPIMLMATVVLSYLAALGLATFVLMHVLGFAGLDPTLPLLAFIFLVALGVDYNIFLMARVREEALLRGTREGVLRGVAVTGGVITSAGVVLAGTFATLAVLPLVTLTEIGLTISLGVLLDTFIVRSLLVPALTLDLGRRTWWPSALSRRPEDVRAGLAASRLVQRPEAQAAPPA